MAATGSNTSAPQTSGRPKRRRRRFSLNGLAIQLSAFALSFTLVALLVVAGSQAAFVEENDSVTDYVPIGAMADPTAPGTHSPGRAPAADPVPSTPPAETPATEPEPEPEPEQVTEPTEPPDVAVELTDSDAGSAMFTDGTALAPGISLDRCIEVTYTGSADAQPVLLYAAATAGDLAPYLDLTVEVGEQAPGSFGTCGGFVSSGTVFTGTLADFAAGHADYGTGLTTWEPTGSEDARSFRFSVSVRDDPAASGRSVSFGFTWELRGA
jgi:hypothetical protein